MLSGAVSSALSQGQPPLFVCVAAHTETSSIPGISAAGASLELIPYTPAADLEALRFGRPRVVRDIPGNPLGPPGPALITRAALALTGMRWLPVTIGLQVAPCIATLNIDHPCGKRIDTGRALSDVRELFRQGQALGLQLSETERRLVIAETVPGGTTTAMAVLRALGLPHRVSSSSAADVHQIKLAVVGQALDRSDLRSGAGALDIMEEVGDPMQPFVLGMLVGATPRIPVILAGGTQMAAVLALAQRLECDTGIMISRERVLLGTTPWVAHDPHADLTSMLQAAGRWWAAVPRLDFTSMRCKPLRAYEQFQVKEGVGAGGAALLALTAGATLSALHGEIDAQYLEYTGPYALDPTGEHP